MRESFRWRFRSQKKNLTRAKSEGIPSVSVEAVDPDWSRPCIQSTKKADANSLDAEWSRSSADESQKRAPDKASEDPVPEAIYINGSSATTTASSTPVRRMSMANGGGRKAPVEADYVNFEVFASLKQHNGANKQEPDLLRNLPFQNGMPAPEAGCKENGRMMPHHPTATYPGGHCR